MVLMRHPRTQASPIRNRDGKWGQVFPGLPPHLERLSVLLSTSSCTGSDRPSLRNVLGKQGNERWTRSNNNGELAHPHKPSSSARTGIRPKSSPRPKSSSRLYARSGTKLVLPLLFLRRYFRMIQDSAPRKHPQKSRKARAILLILFIKPRGTSIGLFQYSSITIKQFTPGVNL